MQARGEACERQMADPLGCLVSFVWTEKVSWKGWFVAWSKSRPHGREFRSTLLRANATRLTKPKPVGSFCLSERGYRWECNLGPTLRPSLSSRISRRNRKSSLLRARRDKKAFQKKHMKKELPGMQKKKPDARPDAKAHTQHCMQYLRECKRKHRK